MNMRFGRYERRGCISHFLGKKFEVSHNREVGSLASTFSGYPFPPVFINKQFGWKFLGNCWQISETSRCQLLISDICNN